MKKVLAIVVTIIVVFVAGFIMGQMKQRKDDTPDPGDYAIERNDDDGTQTRYYLHVGEDGSMLLSHVTATYQSEQ